MVNYFCLRLFYCILGFGLVANSGNLTARTDYFFGIRTVKQARVLLDHSPESVNMRDEKGETLLFRAVRLNNVGLAEFLISRGSRVNARNPHGQSPLHVAARLSETEMITCLLTAGADPALRSGIGATPLFTALQWGSDETVFMLIEKKAAVNVPGGTWDDLPLHLASRRNVEFIDPLIKAGAGVNALNRREFTPLHFAAFSGNVAAAHLLVTRGAKIDANCKNGWTPLAEAVFRNQLKMAKWLLDRGADPRLETRKHGSLLEMAGSLEFTDMAGLLKRYGARNGRRTRIREFRKSLVYISYLLGVICLLAGAGGIFYSVKKKKPLFGCAKKPKASYLPLGFLTFFALILAVVHYSNSRILQWSAPWILVILGMAAFIVVRYAALPASDFRYTPLSWFYIIFISLSGFGVYLVFCGIFFSGIHIRRAPYVLEAIYVTVSWAVSLLSLLINSLLLHFAKKKAD